MVSNNNISLVLWKHHVNLLLQKFLPSVLIYTSANSDHIISVLIIGAHYIGAH